MVFSAAASSSIPSSSGAKRQRWGYKRVDAQDFDEDAYTDADHQLAPGDGQAMGKAPVVLHGSQDAITAAPSERELSFETARSFGGTTVVHHEDSWDEDEPTREERETLRKISDKLPYSAFLVAVVELCERFAYYGMSGPFQNYIANKYHDPSGNPGAIGLGQSGATALTNFFQFWSYLTPILGAVCADQWLGKYNTIVLFSSFYTGGLLILFITSLPPAIEHGFALGGLVIAMLVIGLGTGGIKSNVSPLIAEQYTETKQRIRTLPSGERVIVDPALTIQRIYMVFYMCINLGSLSALATTTMELKIGFWSAYLLPFLMFIVGFGVLVAGKKKYVVRPPRGSVIIHAFKAAWIGARHKEGLDGAKPSLRRTIRHPNELPWDDQFIDELKRALVACKVFAAFPIFWLVFNQMLNNFVSQAGTMALHGIPNDIMQNIDALTIIIFIPICDRLLYPNLRRFGIQFKPITRITWGFLLGALAMTYAAFVQRKIYTAGPCYDHPLKCTAAFRADGTIEHNNVHVALQTPAYFLIALGEIFASITGLEYAYTKAPASMKSFIMSMFLLTSAVGAAIGAIISPLARDPGLVTFYAALAVTSALTGAVFWLLFRKYNLSEESMNELGASAQRGVRMEARRRPPAAASKSEKSEGRASWATRTPRGSAEGKRSETSTEVGGSPLRTVTNSNSAG